jgi:hypothetical protein
MQPLDNNDDNNPCSRSCDPSDTWKGFEEEGSGGGIGSSSSGGSGGNDGSSGSGGMGVDGGGGGGGVGVYYDCALLNWYGELGESACAWHSDPEVSNEMEKMTKACCLLLACRDVHLPSPTPRFESSVAPTCE